MLLIWTSALFLIPTFFAWKRKKRGIQYSCALLTLTSIGYHSSYSFINETERILAIHNPIFYPIDVFVAHTTSIFYLTKSILYAIKSRTKIPIMSAGCGILGVYVYYFKSNCSRLSCFKWHGLVHGCAQLGYIGLTFNE